MKFYLLSLIACFLSSSLYAQNFNSAELSVIDAINTDYPWLGWDINQPLDIDQITWHEVNGEMRVKSIRINHNTSNSFDPSVFSEATFISIDGPVQDSLDFSNNLKLKTLRAWNGNLEYVNISACQNLRELTVYSNNLKRIDVTGLNSLDSINIQDNTISFKNMESVLDFPRESLKINWQRAVFENESKHLGDSIDYSNEAIINGKSTTFVWYKSGSSDTLELNYTGVFTPTAPGSYFCQMTHPDFPSVTFIESKISSFTYRINASDLAILQGIENDNPQANFTTPLTIPNSFYVDWDTIQNELFVKSLDFGFNNLKMLNVSGLLNLSSLTIQNEDSLSNLQLNNLPKLRSLYLSGSPLITQLNFSDSPNLTLLYIGHCNLSNIDLSNQIGITSLRLPRNNLTTIDIRHLDVIENLDLSFNELDSISLQNHPNLNQLRLNNNSLKKLVLTNSPYITDPNLFNGYLNVGNNQLSFFQLEPFINLSLSRSVVLFPQDSLFQNLEFAFGESIDLSHEATVNGINVNFEFYKVAENVESTDELVESNTTGVYQPTEMGRYYVKMSHVDFPNVEYLVSKEFVLEATVSSDEVIPDLQAYPNPASHRILLSSETAFIYELYNSNGQLIKQEASFQTNSKIEVEALERGIYFIRVRNDKGQYKTVEFLIK